MITKEDYFEKIREANLLDDVFMTRVFDNDIEFAEFVLKIILNKKFKVKSVQTQYSIKNLKGHDVRLDIYAESEDGREINIEIQRQNRGAGAKRARYNSSMLDTNSLPSGEDFSVLPETYVIFITENDVFRLKEPIYFIERMIVGKNKFFNDEAHIVYVNNSIQDNTPLGKLMHDFACADPDKMFYKEVKERVSPFKKEGKVDEKMYGIMEKVRRETAEKVRRETAEKVRRETAEKVRRETAVKSALKMIAKGKLTFEEIAEYLNLPLEDVKVLAARSSV